MGTWFYCTMIDTRNTKDDQSYTSYSRIRESEIKQALKRIDNGKIVR